MLYISYRDTPQLYAAVANGEVDWALGSLGSVGSIEKSWRLKFITVAASKRFLLYANVPASSVSTLARNFNVIARNGILASRGKPKKSVTVNVQ